MDRLLKLNLENWTNLDAFEVMIADHGGRKYATTQKQMQEAGSILEQTLPQERLADYHTFSDAVVDAYAVREVVATRIALVHGIAIGAVLDRFRQVEAPETLIAVATGVTTEILASGMLPSAAVTVLETIREAFDAAELAAFNQETRSELEDAANEVANEVDG